MLNFSQAVDIADILECTLDELAGRDVSKFEGYADVRQERLNADFVALPDDMRDAAAGAVHGMRVTADATRATPDAAREKSAPASRDDHPLPKASVA